MFKKRGRLKNNEKWFYDGNILEIVNDFNYLGVVFSSSGSFNMNQNMLAGKGLKAMNTLLNNMKMFDFKPKLYCQLFDAFVSSILNYSCEVWGNVKSKDLERIHLKFCKRMLNVKISASNAGIYGELGRYPLYVNRYVRVIKYWFKIVNSDNCIMKTLYDCALVDCYNGKSNWASNVKNLLYRNGYGYVWNNPFSVDPMIFTVMFKQRLIDVFTQE